jgi:hypothetical protein
MSEVVKVIAGILAHEMDLANGQIMLTNERYNIPETEGLYMAVSYLSAKPIGNVDVSISNGAGPTDGMTEKQSVTMFYQVQIDLMSFDSSARTRKEEVFMALRSLYAEAQMELNTMQIAAQPVGFTDISSLEETKYLNRYAVTVNVTALVTKQKAVTDYYNTFPAQFTDEEYQSPIIYPEEPFNV